MTITSASAVPADARGAATFDGFLRVRDGRLVDGADRPVLLRGIGLGNWLLPEGYMWRFDGGPQSPREIEALVVDLVGERRAGEFWAGFRDAFITEDDIALIAEQGFDHVRLPINSRIVLDDDGHVRPDGFALIDRTIDWCRAHGLWVLLDLHGAPGGQTGTNIDDSPRGRPELFESAEYRAQTVHLWRELATRYAHEPVVAGYDLLNEPLPNEWQDVYADRLVDLYRELTRVIREVDDQHLIVYEGTHWATNWSIFTEVWDPNSVLQFHKYWSTPDYPSIERFVETGRRLGLPAYMGEGGENNPDWLATAFQLYEDHNVSWNFWTWKKLDTRTSPLSVVPPAGWADVVAYAAGGGARPDAADAWRVLGDLVAAVRAEACERRVAVVHGLFRRPPVRLPAIGYSFRGEGVSYGGGHPNDGDDEGVLRGDDPVAIRYEGDGEPGFDLVAGRPGAVERDLVVTLGAGQWVAYEVHPRAGQVLGEVVVEGRGSAPVVRVDGVVAGVSTWIEGEGGWRAEVVAAPALTERREGARVVIEGGAGGTTVRSVTVG
ncbi:hypothetical protein AGMMS50218_12130 [Actinomycetota bacterium]|nr:hypothetical protein AGMMS50218_12130 [Actinomycetota bacterium]